MQDPAVLATQAQGAGFMKAQEEGGILVRAVDFTQGRAADFTRGQVAACTRDQAGGFIRAQAGVSTLDQSEEFTRAHPTKITRTRTKAPGARVSPVS